MQPVMILVDEEREQLFDKYLKAKKKLLEYDNKHYPKRYK